MEIYIKGMEMPSECRGCKLKYWDGEEDVCPFVGDIASIGRHDHCPLVPVPPHGRLGDLDKLAEYFDSLEKEHPFLRFTPSAVESILRSECYSPTIIEAEEGE